MTKFKIQPHPLTYFLSLLVGHFLIFIVLIAFLRFSHGNLFVGLALAVCSTLILALFLACVDVRENEDPKELEKEKLKSRYSFLRGRG
jgi:hypothetical protein